MQFEPDESGGADLRDRREEVERILFEIGWEDIDGIEDWDGEDLEALREFLDEDEFQVLLNELEDLDIHY